MGHGRQHYPICAINTVLHIAMNTYYYVFALLKHIPYIVRALVKISNKQTQSNRIGPDQTTSKLQCDKGLHCLLSHLRL